MTTPQTRQRLSSEKQTVMLRLIKKMMSMGKYASVIKTAIAAEFQLSPRSVERYITRARREMIERLEVPMQEHRAESFYFYRDIIDSPKSTQRDRLRARERIDKLLGADFVTYHKNGHWDQGLSTEEIQNMSDEELEAAYKKYMK